MSEREREIEWEKQSWEKMFEVWWKGVKCSSVVSQSTGYICWLACLLLKWFQFKFSFLCLLLLISVHPSKGARHNSNKQISLPNQKNLMLGSCCGSVGRAVAFDTRGLRFKSSHWQKFIYIEHLFAVNWVLKRQK